MTRGQIAIITMDANKQIKVYTSIEFNGDMYMPTKKWAGHGRTVTNLLRKVNDMASYNYVVAKFNNEHHHYNDITNLIHHLGNERVLNFAKDYFENWFSDYVYIKNTTDSTVTLIVNDVKDNKVLVELAPNKIARICFGRLENITE